MRTLPFGLLVLLLLQGQISFADQANVFIYHRFNDTRYPSTNTASEDFRAHLEMLKQEQFVVLKLGQVVDRLRNNEPLPQRCAVITVDDAYRSFLTDGWPLLRRHAYPVTLFVSTDTVGSGGFLDWRELNALKNAGVEIGNHSASHAYLLDRLPSESNDEWRQRVVADINRSQQAFERHLGSSPALFAYPYGEFSVELVGLIKDMGFRAAFGQQSGVVASGQDLFSLPRFPVGGSYSSLAEFRSKLFMRPLSVDIKSPEDTLISKDNPPRLRFSLQQKNLDTTSLRCFVSGQANCLVRPVEGEGGLYEAEAFQPIVGRRSKYTLTATDELARSWYWYSQLWVRPRGGEVADHPVP